MTSNQQKLITKSWKTENKQTKKENKEKNTPEKGKIISLPMLDTNPEDAGVLFFSFITKRECLSK